MPAHEQPAPTTQPRSVAAPSAPAAPPLRRAACAASTPTGQRHDQLALQLARVVRGRSPRSNPILSRKVTGADEAAMKARGWGKNKDEYKAHLKKIGAEEAYVQIAAFCKARARGKDPPTLDEVRIHLGLLDADLRAPAPKAVVVEGMSFDLTLIDNGTVAVGLDAHQNKHQMQKIPKLKAYTGEKAKEESKYGSTCQEDWHRRNTAPLVRRWVEALDVAGSLDPPGTMVQSSTGEEFEGSGHLFVATAMKDSAGKLYGNYHCYPG